MRQERFTRGAGARLGGPPQADEAFREPCERDVLARLRREQRQVTVHAADGDVSGPIVWHDKARLAVWSGGRVRAYDLSTIDYSYDDGCGRDERR